MTELEAKIHTLILHHIVGTGHGPSLPELAAACGRTLVEIRDALRALHQHHGLVLHPDRDEVWIIHPFSLAPTAFWVSAGRGGWWGNCVWCSLGIAALLKEPVKIQTTLAGEGEPLTISVDGDDVHPSDLLIHFCLPVARAWDNVVFYCSTVLPFRSAADVESWSQRHGLPVGEKVPLPQVWALAKQWYGQYLSPNWHKHTVPEAAAIFRRVGLTGRAWQLPESQGNF